MFLFPDLVRDDSNGHVVISDAQHRASETAMPLNTLEISRKSACRREAHRLKIEARYVNVPEGEDIVS